ncbi:sugar kinase [uncultured Clostridium sp.]|uniref:sugar kinase n=1 Tax=uncultured Clostridium sp. TaxID=59620 RepID=UPI002603F226|nr:sugar kinase [uncultured Clostridium sp.]
MCNILGFGEIMLRLAPVERTTIETSNICSMYYGGAELNVVSSLSLFGNNTKFLTTLADNNIGKGALRNLKSFDIDTKLIGFKEGRMGLYFLEEGHGVRKSKVIYDRKDSAFSKLESKELNFDKILENIDIIHITGITPALSKELREATLDLVKEAKKRNILVSYDSNYRSKLWNYEECGAFLEEVLNYVDIAFLGILDCINLLNMNLNGEDHEEMLKDGYLKLTDRYRNLKYLASTKRDVLSSANNNLRGYIFKDGVLEKSKKYNFDILDRVGGGDAFVAGTLNEILKNRDLKEIIEFGTCASVVKHSHKGDINLAREEEIYDLIENGVQSISR